MKRMDLVKDKANDEWVAKSNGRAVPGTRADTKAEALKQTIEKAKASAAPVSLKIHKENNRIQEERTYPGKADPPKSKG